MKGLLADRNIRAHVALLLHLLEGPGWRTVWRGLSLSLFQLEDVGFQESTPDDQLWRYCQQQELTLLTANRNARGPTSLEATIRAEGTPTSLPVFTLASPERVLQDRQYAEQVVERLLEYLLEIDNMRGAGRIYLPDSFTSLPLDSFTSLPRTAPD